MCPSTKWFVRRSTGGNFCGVARAMRGRFWKVCAFDDWWEGPGRSQDSILPFMVTVAGRKDWEVEISCGRIWMREARVICEVAERGDSVQAP
jgi:hypothetical protein